MPEDTTTTEPVPEPFGILLAELHDGLALDKATAKLHELVGAVHLHGKKGAVQVTIAVEPMKDLPEQVKVTATVTAKIPQATPKPVLRFVGKDGNLTTQHPQQQALPLSSIYDPKGSK